MIPTSFFLQAFCHPAGVERIFLAGRFRRCRCAQPPATVFDASGVTEERGGEQKFSAGFFRGQKPLHEPENTGLDFQRLTRSHPSPLPLSPLKGEGTAICDNRCYFVSQQSNPRRFMVPMHAKTGKGAFHEPENVNIDFQRLTRSHPSPLIPLPVEGEGAAIGNRS